MPSGATRAVTVDISKAFSRIWHAFLLHKLKSYGISSRVFFLISSFLSKVSSGSHEKFLQVCSVIAGVPQDPILGAKLFLLYVNYLLDDVICSNVIYVDYTKIYFKCGQVSDLLQQLKLASELHSGQLDTVDWERKWLVDFIAAKT